jgi:hypothetical protein
MCVLPTWTELEVKLAQHRGPAAAEILLREAKTFLPSTAVAIFLASGGVDAACIARVLRGHVNAAHVFCITDSVEVLFEAVKTST